jgi:hypothetical protein
MIYIIDNGEGVPDHGIYILEVTDAERELFGDGLLPLIKLSAFFGFLIATTAYVNWCKETNDVKTLQSFICFLYLFHVSDGKLRRKATVPPLTKPAIDKLIEWFNPSNEHEFSMYVYNDLHRFSWDEVRRVLSEKP